MDRAIVYPLIDFSLVGSLYSLGEIDQSFDFARDALQYCMVKKCESFIVALINDGYRALVDVFRQEFVPFDFKLRKEDSPRENIRLLGHRLRRLSLFSIE